MKKIMYIAFNGTPLQGYSLGDTIISIALAKAFVESESPEEVILSLMKDGKFNFLWEKFTIDHSVDVIYDDYPESVDTNYKVFNERRLNRKIENKEFTIYKELYRRLEGGSRQHLLCGSEKGLTTNFKNIFTYFYYGQETYNEEYRKRLDNFGNDILYYNKFTTKNNKILIAPEEKCYGNAIFTLEFWKNVCDILSKNNIPFDINSKKPEFDDYKKQIVFDPIEKMIKNLNQYNLVLVGNTGFGWLTSTTDTNFLAADAPTFFKDYRYTAINMTGFIHHIEKPDAERFAELATAIYKTTLRNKR